MKEQRRKVDEMCLGQTSGTRKERQSLVTAMQTPGTIKTVSPLLLLGFINLFL